MTKHKLTPRQKTFVEYCRLIHNYPTHTDAYIAVYKPKGSRRTQWLVRHESATSQPYVLILICYMKLMTRNELQNEDAEHQRFRESLGIEL